MSFQHDVGAHIKGAIGLIPNTITAGGGGDGTEQDGLDVDRLGYHSAKFIIEWSATLAQDATLTLAATVQDTATAGSGHADYIAAALASTIVATGGTGGTTENGTTAIDVDFDMGADDLGVGNRYFRLQFTPTCSATQTDTVDLAVCVVLGGADVLPAA
jgi:hypothetical protein